MISPRSISWNKKIEYHYYRQQNHTIDLQNKADIAEIKKDLEIEMDQRLMRQHAFACRVAEKIKRELDRELKKQDKMAAAIARVVFSPFFDKGELGDPKIDDAGGETAARFD